MQNGHGEVDGAIAWCTIRVRGSWVEAVFAHVEWAAVARVRRSSMESDMVRAALPSDEVAGGCAFGTMSVLTRVLVIGTALRLTAPLTDYSRAEAAWHGD